MRVVVISCLKYRDAWGPFLSLFERFFGGPITLLTDGVDNRVFPPWVTIHLQQGTWCEMLAKCATNIYEPVLVMQDDFFITEPVQHHLIQRATQLVEYGAGCVRIYPCPGADQESLDPYYGGISYEAEYRVSCQAACWSPEYLAKIAGHAKGRPMTFEVLGTPYSRTLKDPLFAFKRDVRPWPIEYLCSAVSKGRWDPNAKRLCDSLGIQADFSMRPMASFSGASPQP